MKKQSNLRLNGSPKCWRVDHHRIQEKTFCDVWGQGILLSGTNDETLGEGNYFGSYIRRLLEIICRNNHIMEAYRVEVI